MTFSTTQLAQYLNRSVLLAAVTVLFISHNAFADTVRTRAAAQIGQGQIVFEWPQPVGYIATIEGRTLSVRFARVIETSLAPVTAGLNAYVSQARISAEGTGVIFDLKGDFGLRHYDSGRSVVVELLDSQATAPQATAPQATAPQATAPQATAPQATAPQAAAALPQVRMRSGVHQDYTRLVFDWPNRVDYRITREADQTHIDFAAPADVQLGALARRAVGLVGGAQTSPIDGGVRVTLDLKMQSPVRDFRLANRVVLDVRPVQGDATPETAAAPQTATPTPEATPETTPEATPAADPAMVAKETPDAAPVEPVVAATPSAAPDTPVQAPPVQEAPAQTQTPVPTAEGPSEPVSLAPVQEATSTPSTTSPPPAEQMNVVSTGDADGMQLRFDWEEPVAAAVFRRAGVLWAVFDEKVVFDTDALKKSGGNIIRFVEQVASDGGTVLRIGTVSGVNPDVRREGFSWILSFKQQAMAPKSLIEISAQPNSPVGSRLFLNVPEPGNPIAFRDPEVGDNLIVVPIIPLGHGLAGIHTYPQVTLQASAQGIVVIPIADDVRVRKLKQGVELTSESSLQISAVSAEDAAGAKLGDIIFKKLSRVLDLERWRRKNTVSFNATRQEMRRQVVIAQGPKKEEARMNLARFYFANGLSAEALGVLRVMEADNEQAANDAEFRAMRGAIRVMMGRHDEAHDDLIHTSLAGVDEADFWLAVSKAQQGKFIDAAAELRRTGAIIRPYPKALRIPLGTLVADAAVELGDIELATYYLEILNSDNPNTAEKDQIHYVEARFKELEGDADGAISALEAVAEGVHRPSRARAAVERTEMLLRMARIQPGEAATELEKLRFAWRGDQFEFNLLKRLGGLYLDDGAYRDGLRTLRQAVTHFREYPETSSVTQQMRESFESLYLDDASDALPPVTAIALYDEFRELTPPGEKGDEMIRKLADRLVGVDLLDRAASLLEVQVDFRLRGLDKAKVGTRLALIYIMDRKYEDALKALDGTVVGNITAELAMQRRHLRAQALIGLARTEEALNLLKEDKTIEADMLRTEVYWRAQDWRNSALTLRRLVQAVGARKGKPLDEQQARLVLNLAIALTLSGNERSVLRLNESYLAAMDNTSLKEAFRLVASPNTQGLVDFRAVAKVVRGVEDFQGFMSAYQQRLQTNVLSAIN